MTSFDYLTKIFYKDIDQMGLVYYARYFEFFEQARTELLNHMGIKVTVIEELGYFLPVISATCDYKEGAKLEDEIIVKTAIEGMVGIKLKINYEIYRKSDNHLLVTGQTLHVFTDKNGEPKRPPKFFIEKFRFISPD
jgi:acyl-CoA thioester hydrolase